MDALARSTAIRGVMEEITTALEWLHGQDPPGDDATAKLVSLPKWTTAQDHQRRTMTFAAQAASGGRGTPRRGGAGSWVPASNLGASLRTGLP